MFSAPVVTGSEPTSRNLESSAIGCSQNDAVVISSDDESEYGDSESDESEHGNVDDGQSDTSFPSVDELLHQPTKHKDAASGSVASAGMYSSSPFPGGSLG
jgi:hypothetical protein